MPMSGSGRTAARAGISFPLFLRCGPSAYAKHELVVLTPEKIIVSPKGKIFVRAVAMQFDRYLRESDRAGGYSKIA